MSPNLLNVLAQSDVLYAEDELGLREQLGEMLGMLFKRVYLAKDGAEALDLYRKYSPKLIIADIQMPTLSGIELVKTLRNEGDQTPVIILSAYTRTQDMLEAIELSLVRYIVKPITETKLVEALERFVSLNQNRQIQTLGDGWFIDWTSHSIQGPSGKFELTKREGSLVKLLLEKKGVCTYAYIEQNVWDGEVMSLNALRLLVKNLRKKLPAGLPKNIQGVGYSL
jgi:DNA-binding response OmpR family regulator